MRAFNPAAIFVFLQFACFGTFIRAKIPMEPLLHYFYDVRKLYVKAGSGFTDKNADSYLAYQGSKSEGLHSQAFSLLFYPQRIHREIPCLPLP